MEDNFDKNGLDNSHWTHEVQVFLAHYFDIKEQS